MIISKLKAKCKEASEELKVLELREAEIDNKQQILRELKQTIERNVTRKFKALCPSSEIVWTINVRRNSNQNSVTIELETSITELMEEKEQKMKQIQIEDRNIQKLKMLLARCGADILDHSHISKETLSDLANYFSLSIEVPNEILTKPIRSIENILS